MLKLLRTPLTPGDCSTACSRVSASTPSTINYSVSPTLFVDFATYETLRRATNPDAAAVPASVAVVQVAEGEDASQVAAAIDGAVEGVEALTREQAVEQSPGVSGVRSSFNIVLGLFYLVVPLVTGLFFLIVTLQKASALTLLRAIGAAAGTLVRSLLVQVAVVVLCGAALATALFAALVPRVATLGLRFQWTPVVATTAVVLVLALATSLVAVRRVLRIDPLEATTGAGVRT
jgi:putative ABC transport system permease protein